MCVQRTLCLLLVISAMKLVFSLNIIALEVSIYWPPLRRLAMVKTRFAPSTRKMWLQDCVGSKTNLVREVLSERPRFKSWAQI